MWLWDWLGAGLFQPRDGQSLCGQTKAGLRWLGYGKSIEDDLEEILLLPRAFGFPLFQLELAFDLEVTSLPHSVTNIEGVIRVCDDNMTLVARNVTTSTLASTRRGV
jgi:hypothetical protein